MRKISFDLDGVIADIGSPFYEQFRSNYGIEAERETFVNCMHLKKPWRGICEDEFNRFNNEYLKKLHKEGYSSLKPFDLAISTLTQLVKEKYQISVNTCRPRKYEDQNMDTFSATKEWLMRFGLNFVELQVAQSSNEKVGNICMGDFIAHVDDQAKVLEGTYKGNPLVRRGLHPQPYGDQDIEGAFGDFKLLRNWIEISGFIKGEA